MTGVDRQEEETGQAVVARSIRIWCASYLKLAHIASAHLVIAQANRLLSDVSLLLVVSSRMLIECRIPTAVHTHRIPTRCVVSV